MREEYENGRDYYALNGRQLLLPAMEEFHPGREFITHHSYEKGADRWATEGLIPRHLWRAAKMEGTPTTRKVLAFGANLRISPAIPAGRIRKEKGDYRIFSGLIGNKKVRRLFNS